MLMNGMLIKTDNYCFFSCHKRHLCQRIKVHEISAALLEQEKCTDNQQGYLEGDKIS